MQRLVCRCHQRRKQLRRMRYRLRSADGRGRDVHRLGLCGSSCGNGEHLCGAACVSSASAQTCGASCAPCSVPANATATCNGTSCGYVCLQGFADCDGNAANGCESDLSRASNCGACGNVCPASAPLCAAAGGSSSCSTGCSSPTPARCGSSCTDTATDVNNCGACGNACPAPVGGTAVCNSAQCGSACPGGDHLCGTACVSVTSTQSCGGSCAPCAVPANGRATCDGTSCGFACLAGFADCDGNPGNGCETSITTINNCGQCSNVCVVGAHSTGATCVQATCGQMCSPGFADCNGNPSDGCEVATASDGANCGGCGLACSVNQACSMGACRNVLTPLLVAPGLAVLPIECHRRDRVLCGGGRQEWECRLYRDIR